MKQRSDSPYDSVAYRLVKLGLSELQAEAEELNQSQIVGTSIVIGLSSRSYFRLPTPTIWFSQDHKRRSHKRIRNENGNFRILPTPNSVALIAPLTTPIFDFDKVLSALTSPTPTSRLSAL